MATLAIALAALGCQKQEVAPTIDPSAVGPIGTIGGMDASSAESGVGDASDDSVASPITIDGLLSESEWMQSASATQTTVTTGTTFEGSQLNRLRAFRLNNTLYVGIDASLTTPNAAIVALLDVDYGTSNGVLYQGGLPGVTAQDAVDQILVRGFQVSDPSFRPELAWSTTMLPHLRTAYAPSMGVRRVSTTMISASPAASSSQCTLAACEFQFDIAGTSATTPIALTVRLGTSLALSNQTLPADAANNPAAISQVLIVR